MNVRSVVLCILVSSCAVYGMQNQQSLYVESSDKEVIEIPHAFVSYFTTLIEEENQQHQHGRYTFSVGYKGKAINFIMRLTQMVHTGGAIRNLISTILLFTDEEVSEAQSFMNYLDPIPSIRHAFDELLRERQMAHQVQLPQAAGAPSATLTLQAGANNFTFDKSLVQYMHHIQNMIDMLGQTLESVNILPVPANSPLVFTDPHVFHALIEMLQLYHREAMKQSSPFNIKMLLDRFIRQKGYTSNLLFNLLKLIDYLEVTILYEPMMELIALYIERGIIEPGDIEASTLDDKDTYYLKNLLIEPLLYEYQLVTMRGAKPVEIIENLEEAPSVTFSRNGLYACANTARRISLIDLENKKIIYSHELPFAPYHCDLNDDGTKIVLSGKEGTSEKVCIFDVRTKILKSVISFSPPVTVQVCALSPDNTKLCVITSGNKVLILSGDNFSNTVAAFNFAEVGQHPCHYDALHWFPSSSKFVVLANDSVDFKSRVFVVGAALGIYNTYTILATADADQLIAVPLDKNSLLMIPHNDAPYPIIFASEQLTYKRGNGLFVNQVGEGLHDAVLSPTGRYILIFSEGHVDIIDTKNGAIIKEFDAMFPAYFNKDDTGLWMYDNGLESSRLILLSFRNITTKFLRDILFALHWPQFMLIINIIHAMQKGMRNFTGFSDAEKKTLLAGGYITQRELTILERDLSLLQTRYNKLSVGEEEETGTDSESSSGSESDEDTMEVDQEGPAAEVPQQAPTPGNAPTPPANQ